MNELREKQILEERQLKQQQDREYQESLIQDKNNFIPNIPGNF